MPRFLKILLIVVGALVALVIAAVLVLTLVIDPNSYKGRIAQEVEKATGREFAILGDMNLSFFPWLGVGIEGMQLANAQGFGAEPMIAVQSAQVRMQLLPLLRREVVLDRIVMVEPVIRLAKDEQGRTNWDDILERMEAQAREEPPAEPETPTEPTEPAIRQLELAGLELRDGLLVWDDRQLGARYEVRRLSASTGELSMEAKPVPVSVSCAFAATQPQAAGSLELESLVTLMLDQHTARAQKTSLKLTIDQFVQQAEGAPQSLSGGMTLSADITARWKEGVAELRGIELTSDLRGEALPSGKADLAFNADRLDVDWTKGTLDLPDFTARAYNLIASGSATGRNLLDKPDLLGTLALAEFNPNQLLQLLTGEPMRTSDPQALGRASARLDYRAGTDSLAVTKLEANLDESVLTGNASVKNFETPDIAFALAVNSLDADRYMPPKAPKEPAPEEPTKKEPAPSSEEKPAESDMLRKMTVNGTVAVGRFQAMGVKASDIRMTIRGKDGVFRVDPFSARMYEGTINGVVGAALGEQISDPSLALSIANLEIGPLLNDYLGRLGWIGGSASAKLDLAGQGVLDDIMKTLSGSGDITVRHGVLRGFTLVPGVVGQLLGTAATGSLSKVTEFNQLGVSFKARQGDLDLQRLFMVTADSKVESSGGKANLAEETLQLPLTMVSDRFKPLAGIPVDTMPLMLTGSYADPSKLKLSVDEQAFRKIVQQQAGGAAQKELQKRLGDTLPGGLDGLGDILGAPRDQGQAGAAGKPDSPVESPAGKDSGKSLGKNLGKTLEEGLDGLLGGGKKK